MIPETTKEVLTEVVVSTCSQGYASLKIGGISYSINDELRCEPDLLVSRLINASKMLTIYQPSGFRAIDKVTPYVYQPSVFRAVDNVTPYDVEMTNPEPRNFTVGIKNLCIKELSLLYIPWENPEFHENMKYVPLMLLEDFVYSLSCSTSYPVDMMVYAAKLLRESSQSPDTDRELSLHLINQGNNFLFKQFLQEYERFGKLATAHVFNNFLTMTSKITCPETAAAFAHSLSGEEHSNISHDAMVCMPEVVNRTGIGVTHAASIVTYLIHNADCEVDWNLMIDVMEESKNWGVETPLEWWIESVFEERMNESAMEF